MAEKPEIAEVAIEIASGTFPDEIGGGTTTDLDGSEFEYQYSTGRRYRLRFYDDRVTFQLLSRNAQPERTLPYLAMKIREGQFLVHWMVPGRIGHVALVIDLETRLVHVAALMPGQQELFDQAGIEQHLEHKPQ